MKGRKIISLWVGLIMLLMSCSGWGSIVSAADDGYSVQVSYTQSGSVYLASGMYHYQSNQNNTLFASLAVYGSDGTLKAVKVKDITAAAGIAGDESITGIAAQAGDMIKGMLWTKEGMKPLAAAAEKTVAGVVPTPTATAPTVPTPTPTIPPAPPTPTPTATPVTSDIVWDFAKFSGDGAINAAAEVNEDYMVADQTLGLHVAPGDRITTEGLFWSVPSGTKADATTTVTNNRYMTFTPSYDGTMYITYKGANNASNKHPRLYVSCGDSLACTTKDANAAQLEPNQMYDNNSTDFATAEFKLTGGKTYYIWGYYYNSSSNQFTVSNVTFKKAEQTVRTRNVYGSNMLLQRDQPIYVDGKCKAVDSVMVTLTNERTGQTVQTKAADTITEGVGGEKDWGVTLDAVSDYTDTYKMTITAGGAPTVEYTNIIFGDQYLCSGQSNMWKEVSYYKNLDSTDFSQTEVQKHLSDKIRVMYTKGAGCYGETDLCYDAQHNEDWRDFSSYSNVAGLPAVAFSLATKLYEEADVPIGIISNAYPGSYISSWFPNTGIDACNANKNGTSNERNWYNGRIYPIRNLNLSGIFWYQGEADASTKYHSEPYEYYKEMMTKLIGDYRTLFRNETLPFYYVQLCRINPVTDENNPDTGAAMKLPVRLAQTDTYLELEDKTNVGVVGTLDIYGKYQTSESSNSGNCRNDIHPGQKKVIGDRLAAYALKDIYGKEVSSHGPVYKSSEVVGDKIIVTYDCTGSLKIMDPAQYTDEVGAKKITDGEINPNILNEFEIAGEDGIWYPATAQITGADQVTVSADQVQNPVNFRYAAKTDYPESANLTDDSGMPSYVYMQRAAKQQPTTPPTVPPTSQPTPTPTSTAAPTIEKTYKFDFGNSTPAQGYDYGVTPDMVYDMSDVSGDFQYGFLGTTEESYAKDVLPYAFDNRAIDGFSVVKGQYSTLSAGGTDSPDDADSDFIAVPKKAEYQPANGSEYEGRYPLRFSMKAERASYYTVTATLINSSSTENACVSLFSEKRQIVAEDVELTPGAKATFKFNVDIEDVTYKEYGTFQDDMLNISVTGENAAISSLTVQKHGKIDGTIKGEAVEGGVNDGITIWCCDDSTGCDCPATVPFFALQNYAGVGQALVKYAPENMAISNQGERGLAIGDNTHFSKCNLKPGDYLYVEYGHNGGGTEEYYNGLQKYYDRATASGASLLIVSPVNRHNNWSDGEWKSDFTGYIEKARQFTQEKIDAGADNIAFVDMNTLYVQWMNEETKRIQAINPELSADNAISFYYRSAKGSSVDGTHMNDAGADQAAYYVFEAARDIVEAADAGSTDKYVLAQAEVVRPIVEGIKTTVGDTGLVNKPMQVSNEIILAGPAPNSYWDTPVSDAFEYKNSIAVDRVETAADPNGSMTLSSVGIRIMNPIMTYAKAVVTVTDPLGNETKYYTENNYDCTGDMPGTVKVNSGFITSDKDHDTVTDGDKLPAITVPQGGTCTVQIVSCDDQWIVGDAPTVYSTVYHVPSVEKTIFLQDGSSVEGWTYLGAVAEHSETVTEDADGSKYIAVHSSGVDAGGNKKNYAFYKPLEEEISTGKYNLSFKMRYSAGVLRFALVNTVGNASNPLGNNKIYTTIVDAGKVYSYDTSHSVITSYDDEKKEQGKISTGQWVNVDCILDIDNGKQYLSIAGSDYAVFDIADWQQNTVPSVVPLRYFAIVGDSQGNATYGDIKDMQITKIAQGTLEKRTITVHTNDPAFGHVLIDGEQAASKEVDISSAVTLKAVAAGEDYEFVNWTDEGGVELSTLSTYEIPRLYNSVTITANFRKLEADTPRKATWDFSQFIEDNAVNADAAVDQDYTVSGSTLGLHVAAGDSVTSDGLFWGAPSGTKSDGTTTVTNNRYMTFTPVTDGTLTVTYKGSANSSKNHPRMYVSCGDSLACTTKDSNAAQTEPNQAYDNNSTDFKTATYTVTSGKTYYIWAYYYNSTSAKFTISNVSYTPSIAE